MGRDASENQLFVEHPIDANRSVWIFSALKDVDGVINEEATFSPSSIHRVSQAD